MWKAICKFVKRNQEITLIGLVALLISISYSLTYSMPDILGIEGWYQFCNNLSISYIAALIFYIVQVYIPQVQNEKKMVKSIYPDIYEVYKVLYLSMLAWKKYITIEENGASIKWDVDEREEKMVHIKYHVKNASNGFSLKGLSDKEICNMQAEHLKRIARIKESIYNKYFSCEIVELLDVLERIDIFKNFILILVFQNTFICLKSMDKTPDNIEKILMRITDLFGIDDQFEFVDVDGSDRIIAEFPRHIKEYENIEMLNTKIVEQIVKDKLLTQIKEKKINISEEDFQRIVESIKSEVL